MAPRTDPFRGYNFPVELGDTVASFRECGGLSAHTDSVDYREGTDKQLSNRNLPGLGKWANITLKRGYTANHDLWNWHKNVLLGVSDRRDGAIVLTDEQHQDVLRWEFENGWICKWEGPAMNATSNDVAIEYSEICHEGLKLV